MFHSHCDIGRDKNDRLKKVKIQNYQPFKQNYCIQQQILTKHRKTQKR